MTTASEMRLSAALHAAENLKMGKPLNEQGEIGGADGGRTHDLRIANAASVSAQVAISPSRTGRIDVPSWSALSTIGAARGRF